jgi:nucleoid DNA-binding protein
MIQHISKLLLEYDCVILPGFGGIVTQYESAKKDIANQLIYPPSKSLAFNVALQKNDGLLQNYLAQHKNISFQEAKNEVEYFVNEVKSSLKSKNTYVMQGVGRFVLGEDNRIQFFPLHDTNYNIASYGLPQLSLVPVARLKKTSPVSISATPLVAPIKEKENDRILVKSNSFSPTYFRVAATVGAIFLLTTLVYHTFVFDKGLNIQEATFISPSPKTNNKAIIEQIISEIEEEEVIEIIEEAEPVTTKVAEAPTTTNLKTVRIIVGSFGEVGNATKYSSELNQKGYKTEVLPGPNGFSRVCIYEQVEKSQEFATVNKIRESVNPNAWLLD